MKSSVPPSSQPRAAGPTGTGTPGSVREGTAQPGCIRSGHSLHRQVPSRQQHGQVLALGIQALHGLPLAASTAIVLHAAARPAPGTAPQPHLCFWWVLYTHPRSGWLQWGLLFPFQAGEGAGADVPALLLTGEQSCPELLGGFCLCPPM